MYYQELMLVAILYAAIMVHNIIPCSSSPISLHSKTFFGLEDINELMKFIHKQQTPSQIVNTLVDKDVSKKGKYKTFINVKP